MTDTGDDTPFAQTERLLIRPWRLDDVDRFFDIYRREEVTHWFSEQPMQSRVEARARIQRTRELLVEDPRYGGWAIVERASGVPAGTVLLKPAPDGDGEIETGWHLHPDSWGRGFATEAARAVLARGFSSGLAEVWCVVDPDNVRSAAVARRLGMRLLGITERWYHEPSLMFWAGATPGAQPSLAPDALPPDCA